MRATKKRPLRTAAKSREETPKEGLQHKRGSRYRFKSMLRRTICQSLLLHRIIAQLQIQRFPRAAHAEFQSRHAEFQRGIKEFRATRSPDRQKPQRRRLMRTHG
jgi:hypothetical protein